MKTRRFLAALLCLAAILACCAAQSLTQSAEETRTADAAAETGRLLADLARAAEDPRAGDEQLIEKDLRAIRALNSEQYEIASAVAGHWQRVFLDPDYRLCLYDGGERAEALTSRGVPRGAAHAVVVLGYELKNGEMQPELKGRCEAGAAVARSYPAAIVVCSGGATGPNNPDKHTEAGLMRDYLVEVCGLDPERIYIDERAMTTEDNAVNTFRILQEKGVHTMTIVTSAYHQRWAEAVYNALAAVYSRQRGYSLSLESGFSYDVEPSVEAYRHGARIAASQIAGILGIPRDALRESPAEG
ncbi:MAG: YdcF family protein [Oscillospiraceae bacterium]|nr:YdcF family protein [Oscillospiraceae bacterium]MBR0207580.1 YdcF family protein [Oscillospiraceae bacterium]